MHLMTLPSRKGSTHSKSFTRLLYCSAQIKFKEKIIQFLLYLVSTYSRDKCILGAKQPVTCSKIQEPDEEHLLTTPLPFISSIPASSSFMDPLLSFPANDLVSAALPYNFSNFSPARNKGLTCKLI